MANAAECPEEGHARLAPILSFKRRLARQGLGRRAVEDEHRRGHTLPENLAGMPLAFIMDRAMPTTV